jgi:prevent-host-death family protein
MTVVSESPQGGSGQEQSIPAGMFKATCLRVLDDVAESGQPVTITKRGKPVARIVPFQEAPEDTERPPLFGSMAGTVTFVGDIISPIDVEWDALRDDDD